MYSKLWKWISGQKLKIKVYRSIWFQEGSKFKKPNFEMHFNPSHAAIKISIKATAAEFICKNIFLTPVQVKKIIKNKIDDIQQIYLYQNVCK